MTASRPDLLDGALGQEVMVERLVALLTCPPGRQLSAVEERLLAITGRLLPEVVAAARCTDRINPIAPWTPAEMAHYATLALAAAVALDPHLRAVAHVDLSQEPV